MVPVSQAQVSRPIYLDRRGGPNLVRTMEFQFGETPDLRPDIILIVIDQFAEGALAAAARWITSEGTMPFCELTLDERVVGPQIPCKDNGPEICADHYRIFVDFAGHWQELSLTSPSEGLTDERCSVT